MQLQYKIRNPMTMIIKASISEINIGSNSMVINLIIMKIFCMELGKYVPY